MSLKFPFLIPGVEGFSSNPARVVENQWGVGGRWKGRLNMGDVARLEMHEIRNCRLIYR